MALVEVFLGAMLTVLLDKLASGELLKFLRRVGIDAQLKEWRPTLLMIEAVLTDAENKQTRSNAVKQWLNDLEDLAYDLEDLVDELNTEASLRKIKENKGSTSKVKNLIPTWCTNLSYDDFMFDRGIDSKLKEISRQLEALFKQIQTLSLVGNTNTQLGWRPYERLPTASLVVESEVYGREEDKEKILEILLDVESNDSPSVIPIVGMGGIGKTTLAQLVYNDGRLKDKFHLKAWVCVSDECNVVEVTRKILQELSPGEKCDYENFNTLQIKLKEKLSNEKFLVVLDDSWNENCGDWDILRRPFLDGKPGSTIIVTTRQEGVARTMSQFPAYHLNLLSESDALSLLAQHAFGAKTFDEHSDLIGIGKSIVIRCKCLPLAVKALGGLLRKTGGRTGWEEVLKSEIWMAEEKGEILPALKLSYYYLPPQLKRCFSYCALFPKDYVFEKSDLVYLWMAEGLLQSKKNMSIEEVGGQNFDELCDGSFFQQSRVNASCFVMHDLFNDLAMSVARDKCLRIDDALPENLVRRLSFDHSGYDTNSRFNFLDEVQKLRTFLPLPIYPRYGRPFQSFLPPLLPNLCLRVLSLNGFDIYELPDSIGDLRHLRYLGLAQTWLKCLPESVCALINLQVLILRGCRCLTKLPTSMENLINLRHLDIFDTDELHEMPQGIAQLTSLQTLTKMTASATNGMRLKDLGKLLQGEISIEELQNVVDVQEAMEVRLMDKKSLNKIRLQWNNVFNDSRNKLFELDVLNALKPHENLSTLEIKYYGGENFSNWIGDSAFSKLAKISFEFCKNCTTLPPLGQLPSLRDLTIQGISQVKVIGAEFYGNRGIGELPFPSLINLTFEDMSNWEEWHGIEGVIQLPRLQELNLRRCSKLVRLPKLLLPSLSFLYVSKCASLMELFPQENIPPNLSSLWVSNCASLMELFPQENIPPNLSRLSLSKCASLMELFPQENIPPNLSSLCVASCGKLKPMGEWGLHKLTSLDYFGFSGCPELVSFPNNADEEHCVLPPSLTELLLTDLPNLETLTKGFQDLTSLQELYIHRCPKLQALPMEGHLKKLFITGCPLLEKQRRLLAHHC